MFWKKNKDVPERVLESAMDLQPNDLLSFKPLAGVPHNLRGETLKVVKVQTYQYQSGYQPEFTLEHHSDVYFLSVGNDDGDIELTLSKKLAHNEIVGLFNSDELASVISDEGFSELSVSENKTAEYPGWLDTRYHTTLKNVAGYFYSSDKRDTTASLYEDDESEEMRLYECEGQTDSQFGVGIEIWEGGETDIFLQVSLEETAIDQLWPADV
ncbi:MAG: hypothetical protein COB61_002935 [Thiotrichales bacterium]|nr:hypothetical protein [Thiotrichales bacterium]